MKQYYTTNPHERSPSNGRASGHRMILPSSRWAATERSVAALQPLPWPEHSWRLVVYIWFASPGVETCITDISMLSKT